MKDRTYAHARPPESFSRQLDAQVCAQEMPYGYTDAPPSYDTHDFDQAALESKKEYRPKRK